MPSLLVKELRKRGPKPRHAQFIGKDTFAYAAPGASVLPDEINESEMSAGFVISTIDEDRDGDTMNPHGCLPTIEEYKKNPIVLFDHHTDWAPVGISEDRAGNLHLRCSDKDIRAKCFFHRMNWNGKPIGEEVFHLVAKKIIRGASVGFLPIQSRRKGYSKDDGHYFDVWRLTEWSVTPLQSNPNTLAEVQDGLRASLDRGEIKTKSLACHLRQYLPPAPVWANGVILGDGPMAKKVKTVSIKFDKSLFTSEAAARWLKSNGRDASVYDEVFDGFVFKQNDGEPDAGRKNLADGVTALLGYKKKAAKPSDDEEDESADEMVEPVEVTEDDEADLEAEEEAENEEENNETEGEASEEVSGESHEGKVGAQDLAALVLHFEGLIDHLPDMLSRNENPKVKSVVEKLSQQAQQLDQELRGLFAAEYPGADLDAMKNGVMGDELPAEDVPVEGDAVDETPVDATVDDVPPPEVDEDEDDEDESMGDMKTKMKSLEAEIKQLRSKVAEGEEAKLVKSMLSKLNKVEQKTQAWNLV